MFEKGLKFTFAGSPAKITKADRDTVAFNVYEDEARRRRKMGLIYNVRQFLQEVENGKAVMPDMTPNRARQVRVAYEICTGLAETAERVILTGRTPDEWDGHEIRLLIADIYRINYDLPRRTGRYRGMIRKFKRTAASIPY